MKVGPAQTQQKREMRRLLVVDDEPENTELVVRTFRGDFEVFEARDGKEALEIARKVNPHVVVTDQRMPNVTGVEFLATLKEEFPHTVRVLVTGFTDYGSLIDAVNVGSIHHYFEKPFHTVDLRTVVDALLHASELEKEREALLERLQVANQKLNENELRLKDEVDSQTQELTEANHQLRQLAIRDGLTGLFNHRYLMEHTEIELARSYRYKRAFAVLFVDVDDFKQVNDRYGHTTGDNVLRRIAELLKPNTEGLRSSDFAARYGGEEFFVVLPETSVSGGQTKAERIREKVEALSWKDIDPQIDHPITVSIGVAAFSEHGETVDALIEAADQAQYAAKRLGKNLVVVAETVDAETADTETVDADAVDKTEL